MVSDGGESCVFYGGKGGRGFGRLLTLPLACFPAPIPPAPFPSGEGGDLRLFYARGSAPCIPGAVPGRHWLSLRCRKPKGGAQGGSRLPTLPLWYPAEGLPSLLPACLFTLAYFLPPSPRPPSRREGGDLRFFYARGSAPCIPGAEPGRHWRNYGQPFAFALAANRRLPDVGHLYGCLCKCRKRLGAGVPGALPPAK